MTRRLSARMYRPSNRQLTGERFGRWLVCEPAERDGNMALRWWCVCDCGHRTRVHQSSLVTGISVSCGCLRDELSRARAPHLKVQRDVIGRFMRSSNKRREGLDELPRESG